METGVAESSEDVVLRDGGMVSIIVSKLQTARDRHAAARVCRLWHDAVTWQASTLVLRTLASLPHLARPFKHIVNLDLSCVDEPLTDADLAFCAESFRHLRRLTVGFASISTIKTGDEGLLAVADKCMSLEHVSLSGLLGMSDAAVRGFSQGAPFLRSVSFDTCPELTDTALEALCGSPGLEELRLKGPFNFTPAGLARVGSECRGLAKVDLELGSFKIEPALKSLAESCPKLRELSLKFKQGDLRPLAKCSSLRSLKVECYEEAPMDGPILDIARANRNLEELVFVSVRTPLTDNAVIGVVLGCPVLEKLHLHAGKLTGSAILCIVNCKSLRHLILDHLNSTGDGLAEIAMCGTGLKSLALRNAKGVRDMEMQSLVNGNRGLESLNLENCRDITPIGFSAIAACRNLVQLDLSLTDVDDVSLLTIASGVHNLQQLTLVKCKAVTDMAAVARFTSLESLNVEQCAFVCDKSLEVLADRCPRLAHLSLAYTRVTDTGLYYLAGCSSLRSLRVAYCRGVHGDGIVAIAKACDGFQRIAMSCSLRGTRILGPLRAQFCQVRLEMDEMAVVPFGYML